VCLPDAALHRKVEERAQLGRAAVPSPEDWKINRWVSAICLILTRGIQYQGALGSRWRSVTV
jgi:hypothetical protein